MMQVSRVWVWRRVVKNMWRNERGGSIEKKPERKLEGWVGGKKIREGGVQVLEEPPR
jgi:hypothetical protein